MHKKSSLTVALVALALPAACGNSDPLPGRGSVVVQCGNGIIEGTEVCDQGAKNGAAGQCKSDCSGIAASTVSVEGDVFAFLTEVSGPRLTGVSISVLEHPEISLTAGDDAHFRIDNLTPGDDLTLVIQHPSLEPLQTATYRLGPKGIQPFSIQAVPTGLFQALSQLVPQPPELDKYCAIVTTVARMGGSLYTAQRQGMPGVTVALDPPVDKASGPIYFSDAVVPSVTQPSTSIDGGALFYRVPPGLYTMTAAKAGAVFNSVRINCRVGFVVNAGPPMGILANVAKPDFAGGSGRPDDEYSAASDAFCDETATCVNAANTPTSYPPATRTSCKAMYRNLWSYVDPACDAAANVRDAAKTFYACRTSSCANNLGDDKVCAAEDTAFRAAEDAYGACLTKTN